MSTTKTSKWGIVGLFVKDNFFKTIELQLKVLKKHPFYKVKQQKFKIAKFWLNFLKRIPTIPHFEALVVDMQITEWHECGKLKDLPCPFLLKSLLFYNQWASPVLATTTLLSFKNLNVHYQSFKMSYCMSFYQMYFWRKLKKFNKNHK